MAVFYRIPTAVSLFFSATLCLAQADKVTPCTVPQASAASTAGNATPLAGRRPILPYTLKQSDTQEQMFANGLTFTETTETHLARNSAGWTRNEFVTEFGSGAMEVNGKIYGDPIEKATRVIISFNEPGKSLGWTEGPRQQHVADLSVRNLTPARRPTEPPKVDNQGPIAQQTKDQLGTRTIEGVVVTGVRTTTVYPANYRGNNLPYREVSEAWSSREYGLMFERTTENARGKTHTIVTSFTPGEPDPSLFQPPSDYTISCAITSVTPGDASKQ